MNTKVYTSNSYLQQNYKTGFAVTAIAALSITALILSTLGLIKTIRSPKNISVPVLTISSFIFTIDVMWLLAICINNSRMKQDVARCGIKSRETEKENDEQIGQFQEEEEVQRTKKTVVDTNQSQLTPSRQSNSNQIKLGTKECPLGTPGPDGKNAGSFLVQTLIGEKIIIVSYFETTTVEALKRALEVRTKHSADKMHLIFQGKLLENHRNLADYGFSELKTKYLITMRSFDIPPQADSQ